MNSDALFEAIEREDAKRVEALINSGIDVNAKNDHGETALHVAIGTLSLRTQEISTLQLLVDNGLDLNAENDKGETVLMVMDTLQKPESAGIVRLLIDAGVDVNAKDDNGETVLYAVINKLWGAHRTRVVQLLIDAGVDVNKKVIFPSWGFRRNTTTALHEALYTKDDGTVKLLISAGADLDLIASYYSPPTTPLQLSFDRDHYDTLPKQLNKFLTLYEAYIKQRLLMGIIPSESDVIQHMQTHSKPIPYKPLLEQPLQLIIEHNTSELETLLRSDSTLINKSEDLYGITLLMFAAALGYDDIVNLLLEMNANPFIKTTQRKTVFDVLLHLINTADLMKKNLYEKIMMWCKIHAYNLVLIPMKKGQCAQQVPFDIVKQNLLLPMIGINAFNFKPSVPLITNPPFIRKKYPGLSKIDLGKDAIIFDNPQPKPKITVGASPEPIVAPPKLRNKGLLQKIVDYKYSIAACSFVGILATLYWHISSNKDTCNIDQLVSKVIRLLQQKKYTEAYNLAMQSIDAFKALSEEEAILIKEAISPLNATIT